MDPMDDDTLRRGACLAVLASLAVWIGLVLLAYQLGRRAIGG
jgi:hypothetical protein